MDIYTIRVRFQNAVIIASSTTNSLGNTEWSCFTGQIAVQITGPASSISVRIERSSLDPQGPHGANPAPADKLGVEINGNPSTGISPVIYMEPAVGWWRAVVTSISGEATVTLSGHHGAGQSTLPGVVI